MPPPPPPKKKKKKKLSKHNGEDLQKWMHNIFAEMCLVWISENGIDFDMINNFPLIDDCWYSNNYILYIYIFGTIKSARLSNCILDVYNICFNINERRVSSDIFAAQYGTARFLYSDFVYVALCCACCISSIILREIHKYWIRITTHGITMHINEINLEF